MCILIILAKSERNCSLLEFLCYNLIELENKIGGKSMRVVILENAQTSPFRQAIYLWSF